MKKICISLVLICSIFLVSCNKVTNEPKTTSPTQKSGKSEKEKPKYVDESTNDAIINNFFGKIDDNKIKIKEWQVIPANQADNQENTPILAFYVEIEKHDKSESVDGLAEFESAFKLSQGELKIDLGETVSEETIINTVGTKTISEKDNEGVKTFFMALGFFLSDESTPVTVTTAYADNKENLDVSKKVKKAEIEGDKVEESNEKIKKPNASEILDIYSSAPIGNLDRNLLSVKQENSDGAIDITIETANGYVHSYFEGDYLLFENKSFEDKEIGGVIKYNYVTEFNRESQNGQEGSSDIPSQAELLSVFADNFGIENKLTVVDQKDDGSFKIAIQDFEAEVEVTTEGDVVVFKLINFRGELVTSIYYNYKTKVATVE